MVLAYHYQEFVISLLHSERVIPDQANENKKGIMEEKRPLTLMLTTREMLYLVASLKLPTNVLLGNPFGKLNAEQLREEISKGRATLEDRRLLKRVGPSEWEYESQVRGVLPFLTQTEYSINMNIIRRTGETVQMALFFRENRGVNLTFKNPYYTLTLYQDLQTLLSFILPLMDVGSRFSYGCPSFVMPATNVFNNLQGVWKKPEDPVSVMTAAGMSGQEAENSARCLMQVDNATVLVLQPRDAKQPVRQAVAFLFTSKGCIWWNEKVDMASNLLVFDPVPSSHKEAAMPDVYEAMFEPQMIKLDPSAPSATTFLLRLLRGNPPEKVNDKGTDVLH